MNMFDDGPNVRPMSPADLRATRAQLLGALPDAGDTRRPVKRASLRDRISAVGRRRVTLGAMSATAVAAMVLGVAVAMVQPDETGSSGDGELVAMGADPQTVAGTLTVNRASAMGEGSASDPCGAWAFYATPEQLDRFAVMREFNEPQGLVKTQAFGRVDRSPCDVRAVAAASFVRTDSAGVVDGAVTLWGPDAVPSVANGAQARAPESVSLGSVTGTYVDYTDPARPFFDGVSSIAWKDADSVAWAVTASGVDKFTLISSALAFIEGKDVQSMSQTLLDYRYFGASEPAQVSPEGVDVAEWVVMYRGNGGSDVDFELRVDNGRKSSYLSTLSTQTVRFASVDGVEGSARLIDVDGTTVVVDTKADHADFIMAAWSPSPGIEASLVGDLYGLDYEALAKSLIVRHPGDDEIARYREPVPVITDSSGDPVLDDAGNPIPDEGIIYDGPPVPSLGSLSKL